MRDGRAACVPAGPASMGRGLARGRIVGCARHEAAGGEKGSSPMRDGQTEPAAPRRGHQHPALGAQTAICWNADGHLLELGVPRGPGDDD